jgi:hypothetical protein
MSVVFYVIFGLSLIADVWLTLKMKENGGLPNRGDYIMAYVLMIVGPYLFTSSTTLMSTNPVKGAFEGFLGLAAMGVCVWMLTIYKELSRRH